MNYHTDTPNDMFKDPPLYGWQRSEYHKCPIKGESDKTKKKQVMDTDEPPKSTDITPVRDLRDIFNFRGISQDAILRAMAMGIIVAGATPRNFPITDGARYISTIEANIMAKAGTSIPGSNHPLTREEAEAIFLFFGTREVMALFFNCF